VKRLEQFAHRGYHFSVITTFSIDFAAFENIACIAFEGRRCNNNIVIADAGMLAHAMESAAELPRTGP